jgi:hypothetical protein
MALKWSDASHARGRQPYLRTNLLGNRFNVQFRPVQECPNLWRSAASVRITLRNALADEAA